MKYKRKYKSYRRGEVIYADLGYRPEGVQSGIRPCVVVSNDRSNHCYAPQLTVCPLTSKIKEKPMHVKIQPLDVDGYHLKNLSDLLAEDIMTISKNDVRGTVGFIKQDSTIMKQIDAALILHLGIQSQVNENYIEDETNAKEGCDR